MSSEMKISQFLSIEINWPALLVKLSLSREETKIVEASICCSHRDHNFYFPQLGGPNKSLFLPLYVKRIKCLILQQKKASFSFLFFIFIFIFFLFLFLLFCADLLGKNYNLFASVCGPKRGVKTREKDAFVIIIIIVVVRWPLFPSIIIHS